MVLRFQGARVRWPGFEWVFEEETAECEVLGLYGGSGSGKTTTLEVLAGLRRSGGLVEIGGRKVEDAARKIWVPARRRRVGYVPQDLGLFPHLSVEANVRFGERVGEARAPEFGEVARTLEIEGFLGRSPLTLSGGERQRVALARALMAAPEVLLLDEPLAALDDARRDRILPYLDRIRTEMRVPMVYVSHRADEMVRLCDQVWIVEGGRVVERGGPDRVFVPLPGPRFGRRGED